MSRLFETASKQIKPGGEVHVTYIFVVAPTEHACDDRSPFSWQAKRRGAHLSCSPRYSSIRPLALIFIVCEEGGRISGRLESSDANQIPVLPVLAHVDNTYKQSASRPQVITVLCPIRSVYPGPGKKTNIIFFNVVVGSPGPDCPYEPRRVLIVVRVNHYEKRRATCLLTRFISLRFKTLTPTIRVLTQTPDTKCRTRNMTRTMDK